MLLEEWFCRSYKICAGSSGCHWQSSGGCFIFRMLGPGDIKVFCALGGIMGPAKILWCIWFSFLCGAGISLALLICYTDIRKRMSYLAAYLAECIRTGSQKALLSDGKYTGKYSFYSTYFYECDALYRRFILKKQILQSVTLKRIMPGISWNI